MSPTDIPDWLKGEGNSDAPKNPFEVKNPFQTENIERGVDSPAGGVDLPDWMITETKTQVDQAVNDVPELEAAKFSGRKNYKEYLAKLHKLDDPFPHSKAPENPDHLKGTGKYFEVLMGYMPANYEKDKVDLRNELDLNEGHKLHLNVPIEHVVFVSEYLKKEGYLHKYIKVPIISDGKIFTIYIGSFKKAYELAAKISEDLDGKLARPVDNGEIEYAPNVIGRFRPGGGQYADYGNENTRGMVLSTEMGEFDANHIFGGENPFSPEEQFEDSFEKLADEYGSYFHGEE